MKMIFMAIAAGVLFLSAGPSFCQSSSDLWKEQYQRIDVNCQKTITLVFESAIAGVDLGSKSILMQRPKKFENVLHLKALQNDFEETNLTVITVQGRVLSFILNYKKDPDKLVFYFTTDPSNSPAILHKQSHHSGEIKQAAKKVLTSPAHLSSKHKLNGIQLSLDGVFIREEIMYFKLSIANKSNLSYEVGQLKVSLKEKKKAKRTSIQETELQLLLSYPEQASIAAQGKIKFVIACQKLTIPNKKYMSFQLFEKYGSRNLKIRIGNQTLLKAKPIQ